MPFLAAADQRQIQHRFQELAHEVDITLFVGESAESNDARTLLQEIADLSGKLKLNIVAGSSNARTPALVIQSELTRGRPRFFGVPAGHELSTLVTAIVAASTGRTQISVSAKETVAAFDKDVHIQVFVTPGCVYCAPLANLAIQAAVESVRITADVVAINEFEDLARRYDVRGVPKTVINESVEFIGAVSEQQLLEYLKSAIRHFDVH